MTRILESRRLPGIEAGRGVAACMVVVYHASRHLERTGFGLPFAFGLERAGHAGVDFFFVLSGFIILFAHRHQIGDTKSLAAYIERRWTRIFPLYWLVLAAWLVVFIFGSSALEPTIGMLAANALLIPTESPPLVGVAWTLHHELMFYLVFSTLFLSRILGAALLGAWAIWISAVAFGILEPHAPPVLRTATSIYNLQFLMGLVAAWVSRRCSAGFAVSAALIGTVGFFATFFAEASRRLDGESPTARLAYGTACALFVVGMGRAETYEKLRIPTFATAIGKASYAIYLIHLLAIGIVYKCMMGIGVGTSVDPRLVLLLLVVSAIMIGMWVSRWIEQPLMAAVRKSARKWARSTDIEDR